MPYQWPSSVPSFLKNLPDGAQKLGIRVFNSTLKKTNSEDDARKALWGAIKQKYEKKGDKWVRKMKSAKESVEEDVVDLVEEVIQCNVDFSEATFDDASKTATATAITEGWSKNYSGAKQRYYTGKAVEDVVHLLGGSRKMFDKHSKQQREVREWVATCLESWIEEVEGVKKAKMKIQFTENPSTVWLYEEAKRDPKEVQLSIDGKGQVRAGKVDKKAAAIIESVKHLRSVDFVTKGAAGGYVDLAASDTNQILNEAIATLEDRIKQAEDRDQPYVDYERVWSALKSLFVDLLYYSEVSDVDVVKEIEGALDGFADKMKDLVPKLRNVWSSTEEVIGAGYDVGDFVVEGTDEFVWEAASKTENGVSYPASAYLVVPDRSKPSVWKLRYKNFMDGKLQVDRSQMGKAAAALFKTFRGKKVQLSQSERKSAITKLRGAYKKMGVPEEDWPAGLKEEKKMSEQLNSFKKENPDLYEEIVEQVNLIAVNEATKASSDKVKELEDRVSELEKDKEAMVKEKEETEKKISDFEEKEAKAKKEAFIAEKLKEAGVEDKVSEEFVNLLKESDEEKITFLISDKKADIDKYKGKIDDNPPKAKKVQEEEDKLDKERRKKLFLS